MSRTFSTMRWLNSPLDGHPHDAAAARLDDVAADDGVVGPVGAFDQHVRFKRGDQVVRRLLSNTTTASTHPEPRESRPARAPA